VRFFGAADVGQDALGAGGPVQAATALGARDRVAGGLHAHQVHRGFVIGAAADDDEPAYQFGVATTVGGEAGGEGVEAAVERIGCGRHVDQVAGCTSRRVGA